MDRYLAVSVSVNLDSMKLKSCVKSKTINLSKNENKIINTSDICHTCDHPVIILEGAR